MRNGSTNVCQCCYFAWPCLGYLNGDEAFYHLGVFPLLITLFQASRKPPLSTGQQNFTVGSQNYCHLLSRCQGYAAVLTDHVLCFSENDRDTRVLCGSGPLDYARQRYLSAARLHVNRSTWAILYNTELSSLPASSCAWFGSIVYLSPQSCLLFIHNRRGSTRKV